ncbi:MAG: cytochrome c3 family protein [Candidatus Zixiibacteriota bacterium]
MIDSTLNRIFRKSVLGLITAAIFLFPATAVMAQSVDDCMMCHEDRELTKIRDGREVSLTIDLDKFKKSIHGDMDCVDCHGDLSGAEFPHEENLQPVDCGMCHDDISAIYNASLHGQVAASGGKLAPKCWTCHGSHDIVPIDSPDSKVTKFNIPFVCGECHKEGTPVTRTYNIPQDSILTHYSFSIHGEGLFKQGLTVSAVCTDCHTAHNVLNHLDPKSSIHRDNVPKTCQKCHGRIEQVHKKVISGELWEKEPNKVPVCVDCHAPHQIRRVFYDEGMADKQCLKCHSNPNLTAMRDGQKVSMYVDTLETHGSMHRSVTCAQCHTGASPTHDRPCETVINKVDCSICHTEVVEIYMTSIHGKLVDRGDPIAPECTDCHGTHGILGKRDPKSNTFPKNVPELCGDCHREGAQAALRYTGPMKRVIKTYEMSIHGKGLIESGLVVTAMCTDCHTAHHTLPAADTASSVYKDNIPKTCAKCHNGIYEQFQHSIHSPLVSDTDKDLPSCYDCHESHSISRTDKTDFRLSVFNQCGRCHEDVTETYFDTFHGKASKLGFAAAAQCYDCHGTHNILPPEEPQSSLSRQNIVNTCAKCHPGSHRKFAGYLTHATHHDKHKYPILFYTFWFMSTLLVGTLIIAGTHTILWLPRSFQAMKKHKKLEQKVSERLIFQRFTPYQRTLHVMVIISFLGLAITGMTLKFSYLGWAQWISEVLGGFESAGYIHRMCAVITFGYFFGHIYDLIRMKRRERKSWRQLLFDVNSMLPNRNDIRDAVATFKWFLGRGPRPRYGRWTYWEKFDYFAVFWGVAIIGSTGLMLWFPEFFTLFLPGWIINVATIIHSDEALLAVAFIFTVHFFNTHFRPDKFPMDPVIFSGCMTMEELRVDRPREYDEMIKERKLKKCTGQPTPPIMLRILKIFGATALIFGLSLILLIIYAEIFGYR